MPAGRALDARPPPAAGAPAPLHIFSRHRQDSDLKNRGIMRINQAVGS
ncbi:hypothetical protein [Actinomyces bowdenii]|uniref:Uncharacterized protein n=1 Tax=Actinomyces bowdenii TaxID=131109 RepID=A0A853EIB3_9ACTO|nr:hypothetical protein [Actinomyces bowdenii]MBF0696950.1 hypothetical protein [Actinomyces bowdenii]NYS35729.1 hypothetical protein [Streptococcus danieliae]NYS69123.1 hypothetical protein [Actinomyces bowdenii]